MKDNPNFLADHLYMASFIVRVQALRIGRAMRTKLEKIEVDQTKQKESGAKRGKVTGTKSPLSDSLGLTDSPMSGKLAEELGPYCKALGDHKKDLDNFVFLVAKYAVLMEDQGGNPLISKCLADFLKCQAKLLEAQEAFNEGAKECTKLKKKAHAEALAKQALMDASSALDELHPLGQQILDKVVENGQDEIAHMHQRVDKVKKHFTEMNTAAKALAPVFAKPGVDHHIHWGSLTQHLASAEEEINRI